MKKIFTLVCITAFILPALVSANDGTGHGHVGLNSAVRKYVKEQILPVLIQKRQVFDRELSSDEKAEIADCRTALKQLHSEHHGWQKPDANAASPNNQIGSQKRDNPEFEQRKAIMQRVQVIAEKHSNSLNDIKTQLEPARKQWTSDIKKLIPSSTNADQKSNDGNKEWHHPGVEGFLNPHHMSARFLLLPTSIEALSNVDEPGDLNSVAVAPVAAALPVNQGLTALTIMPNPASSDLQLGNEILPATNILKVIDLQGKELVTLENVQAGQHLDVSQLANGTYLVQIKSGNQTISKKVVISR